jgi:2,3-diketo-5-methylthio-1-phosphopentane phosphatase
MASRSLLVTDFDGTITANDVYSLLLAAGAPDRWQDYVAGRITHFQAIAAIFAHAPTGADQASGLLDDLQPDPLLGPAIRALEAAGWDVWIASAGCSWYIDRTLERAGVSVPVHANPGRLEPGRGLVMELPRTSPYFSPEAGIDKLAVVRDGLERYEGRVAFAGDGPPDLAPALAVADGLRFARGWLAHALRRRGCAFHPFRRWSEIAGALTGGAAYFGSSTV